MVVRSGGIMEEDITTPMSIASVNARDSLEAQVGGIATMTGIYFLLFGLSYDTSILKGRLALLLVPLLLLAGAVQAIVVMQCILLLQQAERTNPYGEKNWWKAKAIIMLVAHACLATIMAGSVFFNGRVKAAALKSLKSMIDPTRTII